MSNRYRFATITLLGLLISGSALAQSSSSKPSGNVTGSNHNATTAATEMASVAAPDETTPTLATRPMQSSVMLPTGTAIRIKLDAPLSTSTSQIGQNFSGKVSEAVIVEGKTAIPLNATVSGRIAHVSEPRTYRGRSSIFLVPDTVTMPNGQKVFITASIVDTGNPKHLKVNDEGQIKGERLSSRDKVEIVAGTGAGTIIGSIAKLGTGTWIGALVGVGATTGHWLIKKHPVDLPAGTELIMEISNPVTAPTTTTPVAQGGGL